MLIWDNEIYIGDIIVLKQITNDDNIMGKPKYIQSKTKLTMEMWWLYLIFFWLPLCIIVYNVFI
jgi:hypothetical protein